MAILYGKYGDFTTNWKHEVSFRALKMIDIGILFMLASIFGYIVARILSHFIKFDKNNYEKNTNGRNKLILEIILEMALIGIIIYASRQLIQAIPFPFEGSKLWNPPKKWVGYRHKSLSEWGNPYPIAFFIILFQDNLKAKIAYLTELTPF